MLRFTGLHILAICLCPPLVHAQTQPVAPDQSSTTQKKETAIIEGRVVRAGDNTPIKKVTVMAMSGQPGPGGRGRPKAVATDAEGKFIFKDLEPGRYTLSANRTGYARQNYGERAPMSPGTAITLLAGQQVKDILFKLVPGGVITGKILDEDNEPVFQARVEALRWRYVDGRRQLTPLSGTMTNDLGEYRIAQLPPGKYFVSVTSPSTVYWMAPGNSPDIREDYSQTYYPGVFDDSQAAPIEIKGGEEVNGINLRLVPTHAVHVRGVVKSASGKLDEISLRLLPKGAGFRRSKGSIADLKGEFEITGVLPGSYTLMAESYDSEKPKFARLPIEVGDSDIDGITLVLTSGIDVAGRIRVEGTLSLKESHLRVGLRPEDYMVSNGDTADVEDDLTFTLKGFEEGDYRLSMWGLPGDAYIKSVYSGTKNVLEDGFQLSGQPKPLEIIISANGGRVEGMVTDSKDNPVTGARVVLVPDEAHRKREDLFKFGSTDQYGRFSLHGVTPGAYTIYAWESLEEGAYQDPDFLKQYADLGKPVRVSESSQLTVDLKVIPTQTEAGN